MKLIALHDNGAIERYGQWTAAELLSFADALRQFALSLTVDFGQPSIKEEPPMSREKSEGQVE